MAPSARRFIIDDVPRGFRCPMCSKCRPSPYQWATCTEGSEHPAICRSCMRINPQLLMHPMDEYGKIYHARAAPFNLYAPKRESVEDRDSCVVCMERVVRRPEAYCKACRYLMIRDVHGGLGAFRRDFLGRCFQVYDDSEYHNDVDASRCPREAFYPWGREALSRHHSFPSTGEDFDRQTKQMWAVVEANLERICGQVRKAFPSAWDEEIHDAAVIGACKGALTYDADDQRATIRTYMIRAAMNEARGMLVMRARRAKRERAVESYEKITSHRIDEVLTTEMLNLFGGVLSPKELLDEMEMSEWERKLLTLHYVDGLTFEQMGIRYGVVRTTVHKWLWTVKQKFFIHERRRANK